MNVGAGVETTAAQAAQAHFFPSRPPGAAVHRLSGILTDFGIGNDAGGFEIIAGKKKYELYVSADFQINGKRATCSQAPMPNQHPDPYCKWPSNIVIGKTMVTTAYWLQKMPGTPGEVMVANEFHSSVMRNEH
jgi:hypothetical protein